MKGPSLLPLFLLAQATRAVAWCSCTWLDGRQLVGGLAEFRNDTRCSSYNRLPAPAGACGGSDPAARVSAGPWSMLRAPTGAFLQFTTDSTLLYLNASVLSYLPGPVTNLDSSVLGWGGFDMYARASGSACNNATVGPDGGCWRWVASSSDWLFKRSNEGTVGDMTMAALAIPCSQECQKNGEPPLRQNHSYRFENHTFRLHLPTHLELQSISVGVPSTAYIAADTSWRKRRPIVW